MSEFDFLKEFGKKLDQERRAEASDADWEKVAVTLDTAAKRKRRRHLLLLWAWPLAAMLPLSTALLHTMARADRMQTEMAQLRRTVMTQSSHSMRDTTVRHFSVIQYDTVYRTLVIQEGRWTAGGLLPTASNFDRLEVGRAALTFDNQDAHPARIADTPRPQDSLAHAQHQPVAPDTLNRNAEIRGPGYPQSKASDALAFLPVKSPELTHSQPFGWSQLEMPPFNSSAKRPLANIIHRYRPHSTALGLSVGTVWPQLNGAQSYPGFTGGVATQVAMGEHIRLIGELRWSRVWFKIENGDQNAPDIPSLTPPTPDDVLQFVQVWQPSFDYSLGLRYQLRPERKMQPYLALGWTGTNMLEQALQYEFHNATTEAETQVELPYTEKNVFRSRWQVGLGTEWRLSKRLATGGEAFWQNSIGQGGFLEGPHLGLKAHIFYFL